MKKVPRRKSPNATSGTAAGGEHLENKRDIHERDKKRSRQRKHMSNPCTSKEATEMSPAGGRTVDEAASMDEE